jgi:hypothetical protein
MSPVSDDDDAEGAEERDEVEDGKKGAEAMYDDL